MNKLLTKTGMSKLVVIMGMITLALFAAIVIPTVFHSYEHRLEKKDEDYIVAAKRLAEYTDFGKEKVLIYDGVKKTFVKPKDMAKVKPYAMSKEHKGQFIGATINGSGKKTSRWMSTHEIEQLSKKRTK